MTGISTFFDAITQRIADATTHLGDRVVVDASVLDRSDSISLSPPGLWSANRFCRFFKTGDGWIAANLPREEDHATVPALLETSHQGDAWDLLDSLAPLQRSADLVARADLLGLAIASIGETAALPQPCAFAPGAISDKCVNRIKVVDFSSLWAGPLCASIFSEMGAEVVRIEAIERPDPTAEVAPLFDKRLNSAKHKRTISLVSPEGREALLEEITCSNVLVTNARARALEQLGLTRGRLASLNPQLVWVAITGHGWRSNRVAFGDDAAAAGGFVDWNDGAPRFKGDALADPLTGLAAAAAALDMLAQGRGAFIDAALAHTAAYAAALGSART